MASAQDTFPQPAAPVNQAQLVSTNGHQQAASANGHSGPTVLASAPSLRDHLGALTKAVQLAQEQQSMLRAFAMNPGVPVMSPSVLGPGTTSMKRNMDAVSYAWGDPNAQLDAMLKEAVSTRLRQRAPTLRRKAAQSRHGHSMGEAKGEATAKDAGAQQKGSEDSWEVLPRAGSSQNSPVDKTKTTSDGLGSTAQESSAVGNGEEAGQQLYYYDDEEDDVYALYEADEGFQDGQQGAGAVTVPEGQEEIFEEVLELRLKLHDLDSENAVLRRQLEQQRMLMEQMQASLLLNAPAADAAGAAANHSNGRSPAMNGAAEPRAVQEQQQPHSSTTLADAGSGFDALAAMPSPNAIKATDAGTALQPAAAASAGAQEQSGMQARQQPAVVQQTPVPVASTAASNTSNSAQPFMLAPDTDILEGLGLSTSTAHQAPAAAAAASMVPSSGPVNRGITNLRASAPEAFRRPVAGQSSSAPLGRPSDWVDVIQDPRAPASANRASSNRRASDGEVAAIMAVEEYERAQQQALQQQQQQQQQRPTALQASVVPVPAVLPPPQYGAPAFPPNPAWAAAYPPSSPYPAVGPAPAAWGHAKYHAPHPSHTHAVPGYPAVPQGFGSNSGNWGPFVGPAGPHPVPPQPTPNPQYMPPPASSHEPRTALARGITMDAQHQGTALWAGMPHPPYSPGGVGSGSGNSRDSAGGTKQNGAGQSAGGGMLPVSRTGGREEQDWQCQVCTYLHTGSERLFLKCAVCNAQR